MQRALIDSPVAKENPQITRIHDIDLVDPYAWLRDRKSPDVISYLEAENAHTATVMAHTGALQNQLYEEMVGRIQETDCSVPVRIDDFFYYTRTEAGLQYPIYGRRQGHPDAPEEILLDLNRMAAELPYLELGVFKISPDHRFLAYSLDEDGSERFVLRIKDLVRGKLLAERIDNTAATLIWSNDNETLFYATLDAHRRPNKVLRHVLGDKPTDDRLMYHEQDERFFLGLFKTRSRRYLGIELASKITSEVHLLEDVPPAAGTEGRNRLAGDFTVLFPRRQGVEYRIDHHEASFYVLTNDRAQNFRLLKAPVGSQALDDTQEIIPHRSDVKLEGIDLFRHHMVVYQRREGLRHIEIWHLEQGEIHDLSFAEPVYTVWPESNPSFDTSLLRFGYSSLVTPKTVFDYDMEKRERTLLKQVEVRGGYQQDHYTSERIFATAPDGERVPISLVYKGKLQHDGQRPLLLYGYGAYGMSIEARFSASRLCLIDRGFVYAIAHVRGGGEMGRPWYDQGKLLNKKNTFSDFIAAAEHLVAAGYTSRDRLVIRGGSAGGLLIGAVLNQAADLFKAAIAEVPFVDVINTMLDPSIPLTVVEFEEWGNPQERELFDYIRSYSPYDNVTVQAYPHLLITAGLNDPRVQYWEPAKWTARLRQLKTGNHRLLLRIDMDSGHTGASGRYDALREEAFKQAFVLDVLGAENLHER